MHKTGTYLRRCRRCDKIFKAHGKAGRICPDCTLPMGNGHRPERFGLYVRYCRRCKNYFKTQSKFSKACPKCHVPKEDVIRRRKKDNMGKTIYDLLKESGIKIKEKKDEAKKK